MRVEIYDWKNERPLGSVSLNAVPRQHDIVHLPQIGRCSVIRAEWRFTESWELSHVDMFLALLGDHP